MATSAISTNTARSFLAPGFFLILAMMIMTVIPSTTARSDSGDDYYYSSLFREAPDNYEEKNVRNLDGIDKSIKSKILRDDRIIYNDSETLAKVKYRKNQSSGTKTNGGLDIIGGGHLLRTVHDEGNQLYSSQKDKGGRQLDSVRRPDLAGQRKLHGDTIRKGKYLDKTGDENLLIKKNIFGGDREIINDDANRESSENQEFQGIYTVGGENFLKTVKDDIRKSLSSQNDRYIINNHVHNVGGGYLQKQGKHHDGNGVVANDNENKNSEQIRYYSFNNLPMYYEFPDFIKKSSDNERYLDPNVLRQLNEIGVGNLLKINHDDGSDINLNGNGDLGTEIVLFNGFDNPPIYHGFSNSITKDADNNSHLDQNTEIVLNKALTNLKDIKRHLDQIGGGNLLKRGQLDLNDGKNIMSDTKRENLLRNEVSNEIIRNRRHLDQIGGGNLLKKRRDDIIRDDKTRLRNQLLDRIGEEVLYKHKQSDLIHNGKINELNIDKIYSNVDKIPEIVDYRRHVDKLGGGNLLRKRHDDIFWDNITPYRKQLLYKYGDGNLFTHRQFIVNDKDDGKFNELNIDKIYGNYDKFPESFVDYRRHVDQLGGGHLL